MNLSARPQKNFDTERFLACAIAAAALWYVALCLVGYLSQRPLWNDEECVLRSLKAFNVQQMFGAELAADQVFPRAYLFLIQQLAKPFHFHLLLLKLLPLLSMLLAFFLWIKIARDEFTDKAQLLTFVLSWPASAVLIYYASELKQYSMDVLVAAVFLRFICYRERPENTKRDLKDTVLLISLPFLGFFSYIAFLFALILFYDLCVAAFNGKTARRRVVLYGVSLLTVCLLSYFFDMRYRHASVVTKGFHDYFISFDSLPEFLKTLGEGTNNLFSRWFVERPKILKMIGVFFVTFGLLYLFAWFFKDIRKDRYRLKSVHTIAFFLFLGLFLLGTLKLYPFTVPRTSLFFCPIVLFLTIKGIAAVKNINGWIYRIIHAAYFVFLIFLMIALSRVTFAGQLTFRPVLW